MDNLSSLKSYFSSEIVLMVGVILLVFLALRKKANTVQVSGVLAFLILVLALVAAIQTHFTANAALFHGMISLDPLGQFFKILIITTALVTVVMSASFKDLEKSPKVEFYGFLLALTLGLSIMSVANDLLMMYLAIEMSSIISYIMTAYLSHDKRSEEAGLKYVLYGGIVSGVMIFGMSLLYGLCGTLNLIEMREFFLTHATDRLVLFITFIMVLTGLGYKMAIAPFHMWSPDVYEGAPLPVTAFLSVASKAAGFAMTLRFFFVAFISIDAEGRWSVLKALDWQMLVAVLAAITMTVGNVIAIQQTNIKRFLAYSSIAHAGYMLMGIAVQSRLGVEGIVFYFIIYFFMNLGAFLVAQLVANHFHTEDMSDYKGLARRGGLGFLASLCFSIFLFSLAGIPPFAGFVAKWYVFRAVIDANLIWLAVVGAVNAVISLFYYVRLAKYMLIDDGTTTEPFFRMTWRFSALLLVFAAFTVWFGIYFEPIAHWAQVSSDFLH